MGLLESAIGGVLGQVFGGQKQGSGGMSPLVKALLMLLLAKGASGGFGDIFGRGRQGEPGPGEVRAGQVRVGEVRPAQVRIGEHRAPAAGPGELGPAQARAQLEVEIAPLPVLDEEQAVRVRQRVEPVVVGSQTEQVDRDHPAGAQGRRAGGPPGASRGPDPDDPDGTPAP